MNLVNTKMTLFLRKHTKSLMVAVMLLLVTSTMPLLVFAATNLYTEANLWTASTDNQTTWSYDTNSKSFSGKVQTTAGGCDADTQEEGTLTLTYIGSGTGTISFKYTVPALFSAFTINENNETDGEFTATGLANGDTVTIYLKSPANNYNEQTVTISNLSVSEVQNVTLNFEPVEDVSYTVNNNTVFGTTGYNPTASNTTIYTISKGTTTESKTVYFSKAILTWTDSDNVSHSETLYPNASGQITPTKSGTITPVFVADDDGDGKAPFKVGSTYYWTWDDAFSAAGSSGTVILNDDYTLPSRTSEYIVQEGVTFLVPFDDANTLYTTEPGYLTNSYTTPTSYRTLTMADGATITVNGAMSISANVNASSSKINEGSPTGKVGMVKMQGTSAIVVNGSLYCWGFIWGSGSVTVTENASVYECFQFMDHRGGTQSALLQNGIFPISQYYVQNIEVPLTLRATAREYAYTVLYTGSETKESTISFIGSTSSMFTLSSGFVTKEYDGDNDRLIIDVYGDVSLSPITIDVGSFFGSVNSQSYELPINSNITIKINSGIATIDQDLALLPCTEIYIEDGASCVLGSEKSVYVYDVDQWEEFVYAENYDGHSYNVDGAYDNIRLRALTYAPGRAVGVDRQNQNMVDAKICVNGTLDASAGYLYTTTGPMMNQTLSEEYPNHYNPAYKTAEGDPKDPNIDHECIGGANIYSTESTGRVIMTSGTQTATYQIIQDSYHKSTIFGTDDDADYDISIPITSAKLLNANTENGLSLYTETAGSSNTTYNYSAEHQRWVKDAHAWGEWQETAAPTCTQTGTQTRTCSCGVVETRSVETSAHTGGTATCVAPAVCDVCGQSYGEKNSTNHNYSNEWKYDATSHWQECANGCGEQGATSEHAWQPSTSTDPAKCEICGYTDGNTSSGGHTHSYTPIVTEPTCTTGGYTTYTCSCGDSYTADDVPPLGHTFVKDTDSSKYICSTCDETVDVPVQFVAIQLSAESEVLLKLKLTISDELLADEGAYIVLTEAANEVTQQKEQTIYTIADLQALGTDASGRYVLSQGIAAGEMTGEVSIQAFNGNNTPVYISDYTDGSITTNLTRTVIDYTRLALGKGTDAMKDLSTMMVTFGGYAQEYFGVDTDNPAYNVLSEFNITMPEIDKVDSSLINQELQIITSSGTTSDNDTYSVPSNEAVASVLAGEGSAVEESKPDEIPDVETDKGEYTDSETTASQYTENIAALSETNEAGFGVTYKSQNIKLDSRVFMTTFFTLDSGVISDYTFTLTYTQGGVDGLTKKLTPVLESDGRYSVKIEDIPVAYWDYMYKITVTKEGSSETYQVVSSILAWAKRCIDNSDKRAQVAMAKAMYYYNQAANIYFNR